MALRGSGKYKSLLPAKCSGSTFVTEKNVSFSNADLRPLARLEVEYFELRRLPALILIDAGSECQAAGSLGRHHFVEALGHVKSDGAEGETFLADAEAEMALAAADTLRRADDLHGPGEENRPRIAGAVGFELGQGVEQAHGQGAERHLGVDG